MPGISGSAGSQAIETTNQAHPWVGLQRRKLRDPWQWITAVIVLVPLVALFNSLRTNPALEIPVIGQYLFDPTVLSGVLTTISLAAACLVGGFLIGLVVVALRMSQSRALSAFAIGYIWVVRSVPPLVQILFWYNFGALYPRITIEVPLVHWVLLDVASSNIIGSYVAALVGLTLIQGAYQAEIFRGGLLSAARGQKDAALAIGMTNFQAMRRVVFPQTLLIILPSTGNQFIHLVKSTSIVSFVALGDILYSIENIYNVNGKVIPLLVVAICWYLVVLGVAALGQAWLEKSLRR